MEESSFEIDPDQLAEASRLFPAHRLIASADDAGHGVSRLVVVPGGDFARHAWDEAGTL